MYFESETSNKKTALLKIYLLGAIGFCLLVFLSVKSVIPSIEKDILNNVSEKLLEHKITNVIVSVKGQEVTLEGLVSKSTQTQAIQAANQIPGVTQVNSEFILVENDTTPREKQ